MLDQLGELMKFNLTLLQYKLALLYVGSTASASEIEEHLHSRMAVLYLCQCSLSTGFLLPVIWFCRINCKSIIVWVLSRLLQNPVQLLRHPDHGRIIAIFPIHSCVAI